MCPAAGACDAAVVDLDPFCVARCPLVAVVAVAGALWCARASVGGVRSGCGALLCCGAAFAVRGALWVVWAALALGVGAGPRGLRFPPVGVVTSRAVVCSPDEVVLAVAVVACGAP